MEPSFADFYHMSRAAKAILAGLSPWEAAYFYGPPWAAMVYIPFVFMPTMGVFVYTAISALILYIAALKLSGSWVSASLFLLNPLTLMALAQGNLEWLLVVGLILPANFRLVCYSTKPQLALGGFVHILYRSYRTGRLLKTVALLSILFLVSCVIYGFWPIQAVAGLGRPLNGQWNVARFLWPWMMPVGVALLVVAIKQDNHRLSMAASLLLSPYVGYYSLGLLLLAVLKRPLILFALDVLLWGAILWWIFVL